MPLRARRRRGWIEQRASGSHRAWVYGGTGPLTGRPRRLRKFREAVLTEPLVVEADGTVAVPPVSRGLWPPGRSTYTASGADPASALVSRYLTS
jgi:hypothetical protein